MHDAISETLGTEAWMIEEDHKAGIPVDETPEQQRMMDAWYAGRDSYSRYVQEYKEQMRGVGLL